MSNKEKHSKDKAAEDLLKAAEEVVNEAAEDQQSEEPAEEPEATEADKVQEMGEKLAEMNDKYLRLYSEYENYRKRTTQEKADLLLNGSREMMKAILPVIDDFERAIAANEKVEDINAIKEGFNLIYNKLLQMMKRFDVEEIQAKGEEFNTDFHEAVTHFPAQNEEDKGKVIDVTEKGYKLKDKVIRYAKVVVGQ